MLDSDYFLLSLTSSSADATFEQINFSHDLLFEVWRISGLAFVDFGNT